MISGSKSGSTTFVGATASAASGTAMSAHLHEERLFFGEDLRVGVVVQGDGLRGALADADPAALAGGRFDLGFLGLHVDDRHLALIHISEPTRRTPISYAVFCLKKKK